MIIDSSTGQPPTFDTTEDVLEYSLPSNVAFVENIIVRTDEQTSLMRSRYFYDYGGVRNPVYPKELEYTMISGVNYEILPWIRSYPATENSVAKVLFSSDPGASTDIYRYMGYKLPTEITADTIPLSIHPPYDILYLLPATAKLMEGVQNGNYTDAIMFIEKEYVSKMNLAFNIGTFGVDYNAEDRGF
jgi:hypothetical protein